MDHIRHDDDDVEYINGYPLLESLLKLHEDRGPDISEVNDSSSHQFVESLTEVTTHTTIAYISNKFRYQESIIEELKAKIEKVIDNASLEVKQNIADDDITSKLITLTELVSRIQKSVDNQNYLMQKLNARDNNHG